MRSFLGMCWRRIRANWNGSDTLVLVTNTSALALFIANAWWNQVAVTYIACVAPLLLQSWAARRDTSLRMAVLFGAGTGLTWPFGEGLVVHTLGWWGEYLAPGARVWETPWYCILVGWLAGTYCCYAGKRAADVGYGLRGWVLATGISALFIGSLGENLFVWAGMWSYHPSALDIGKVPLFVPLGYAIGYSTIPLFRRFPAFLIGIAVNFILIIVLVALGLAMGFFPR